MSDLDLMEDGRAAVLEPETLDGLLVDEVFVDGMPVRHCIYVDRRRGLVRFYATGPDGRPVVDGDGFRVSEAFGDVTVTWKEQRR